MTRVPSLTGSRDFTRVFRTGRRGASDGVTVVVGRGSGPSRLGMSVRRSTGSAVARNRARRRLREIWRRLDISDGADVVIQVDAAAVESSFQELEGHVATGLRRTGVLR